VVDLGWGMGQIFTLPGLLGLGAVLIVFGGFRWALEKLARIKGADLRARAVADIQARKTVLCG